MDPSRGFILLVVGVLLVLSVAMVLPFLQFFLLALLLAYMFMPVQKRLENRVSSTIAAGIIVAVATVALVIPLVYITRIAVMEAVTLIEGIREGEITFEETEDRIADIVGVDVSIVDELQTALGEFAVGDAVWVVDTFVHVLLGIGLTVFLLYYFLKDGDSFIRWLQRTVPMSEQVQDRISEGSNQIMKAVLFGHILIAFVQGILAGIGLVVTGVPNPVLWTTVMIVLSLLPIVGSFLIWGPAVAFLFLQGDAVLAAFLGIWGLTVVAISDDYLRPIVVDKYAGVNPSVIIIGVLGGIFVFGFMGIFFGPLIIGVLRVTLDVFRDEFVDDEDVVEPED